MKFKQLLRFQGWFFLLNSFLLWILGFYYLLSLSDWFKDAVTIDGKIQIAIFLITAYIGQFTLIAFIPCLLLIPLTIIIPWKKLIISLAVVSGTLIATIILIDSAVYHNYHFHLQGVVLSLIFSPTINQDLSFSWLEYTQLAIVILGIFIIEIFFAWIVWHKIIIKAKITGIGKYWAILLLGCFYFSWLILLFSSHFPIFRYFFDTSRMLPYYNSIFATVIPGKFRESNIELLGQEMLVQPLQSSKPLHYPLKPLLCTASKKPMNIVFLIVDTWRYDMVNPTVMPYLSQFSKNTLIFNNHFSGGNATQPGIFSLYYGLPANYWAATIFSHKHPLFIDKLLENNYQMGIFTSAELFLPAFNDNIFYGIKNLKIETPGTNSEQRDEYITNEFAEFIQKRAQDKKPFFSYLFYDGAHGNCNSPFFKPFQPAIKVCDRFDLVPSKRELYFNRYKNSLYFVDQQIKKDITLLQQKGLLANTLIVITGDHGQEFDDNHLGYWGHASNFTKYQVQTPFMIYWPNKKPQTFNYQTTHYDVTPTLLQQVFQCTTPYSAYSVAVGLFNPSPRPYIIVGSYVDFGFISQNQLITIYPTGSYLIQNKSAEPIPNTQLNIELFKKVLADLRRFYR